jgi:hypothetical protein
MTRYEYISSKKLCFQKSNFCGVSRTIKGAGQGYEIRKDLQAKSMQQGRSTIAAAAPCRIMIATIEPQNAPHARAGLDGAGTGDRLGPGEEQTEAALWP